MSSNSEITLCCICIFATYLGYILGIKRYWLPFSLDVAMASVIFYYVGYVLSKKNLIEKILNNKKILMIILMFWIIGIRYN